MIKSVLKLGALSLLAAAIAAAPTQLLAQSTNKPAAEKKTAIAKKEPAAKKKAAHPFRGKLAAVDKVAKTIKVGESIYQITSETKITKDGKPAILSDITVGATVSGAYKKDDAGKLNATTIKAGEKKKKKTAPAQ